MSKFDVEGVRRAYAINKPYYLQVVDEVSHVLNSIIGISDIKIHNVTGRVKEIESLIEKSIGKQLSDPLSETRDICGVRVICLFRDDLEKIEDLINNNFVVIERDDKISSSDGFGYMSIHYICNLKESFSGPRYDRIKDHIFEIQTRTICMDAWAAVSHYLAYKGQWDVPAELQKAMNALSGLFYVADSEFQQVYMSKLASTTRAQSKISTKSLASIPTNLDTLTAYLKDKLPDRDIDSSQSISDLVHQILAVGYDNIYKIDKDLSNTLDLVIESESRNPPSGSGKYTAVGVLRVGLSYASEEMEIQRCKGNDDIPYGYGIDGLLRQKFLDRQQPKTSNRSDSDDNNISNKST